MSTRAAVIVKIGEKFKGIYNHSDGRDLLPALEKMCQTQATAEELVALGSCSVICGCERIKPIGKHAFGGDNEEPGTVLAYHRDRLNPWADCKPVTGKTWQACAKKIGHNGYAYVFENGKWTMHEDVPVNY